MNKMLSTCVQNICRSYTQKVAGPKFRGEENKGGRTVYLELGSEQTIMSNESCWWFRELVWLHMAPVYGQLASCCEHGNERWNSV